jgi:hypothetical protein
MKIFFIAALGSLFQEFLHHVDLQRSLRPDRYRKLVRSVVYYALAGLMIVLSAAVVSVAYSDQPNHLTNVEVLILGAAAPALFKDAVSAATKRKAHAGVGAPSIGDYVRDYFNVG